MSTSGYPEAPPASDVAFDVERFEWTAVDRLEVRGRWTGVRGRRFMRPSLNVGVTRGRRRLIALLEHKPWAAGDGDTWVAAFPWEGERGDVGPAVLEVGAGLAVELPPPREPRHVREAAAKLGSLPPEPLVAPEPVRTTEDQREEELWRLQAALAAARREADLAREQLTAQRERSHQQVRDAEASRAVAERERDRLRSELGGVREELERELAEARRDTLRVREALQSRTAEVEERDRALREREQTLAGREAVTDERDAARRERDAAIAAREAAVGERDRLLGEREELVVERERAVRERRAAVAERDATRRERDAAVAARDAALAERDRVARVRQGGARPAAGATEPAVKVLGPVRDEGFEAPVGDAAPEPIVVPTGVRSDPEATVPLIEDQAVASRSPVAWDGGGTDPKPLLTRAEPLDSRALTALWMLRLAAVVLLVAVVAALLLVAGVL
jgi:hypothetical protein